MFSNITKSVFVSLFLMVSIFCKAQAADEEGRPAEHYCPITHAVMTDPVVASDGHSYERTAIQEYLGRSERFISPFTREPLEPALFPNRALREVIQDWRPARPEPPRVAVAPALSPEEQEAMKEILARRRAEAERKQKIEELTRAAETAQREETELRQQARALQARADAAQQRHRQALESLSALTGIPAPVTGGGVVIPDIARGHEEVYRRFVNGRLIYKPNKDNDVGRVDMPIAAFANPLDGQFDLSRCGDSGQHLAFYTGYRKGKIPANESKVEVWFAPRFLIERELATTAGHFRPIMANWDGARCPVGIFWTWGVWTDMGWYDYLTTRTVEEISSVNIYENWSLSTLGRTPQAHTSAPRPAVALSCFIFKLN